MQRLTTFFTTVTFVIDSAARKSLSKLEAAIGIEPMNKKVLQTFTCSR